MGIYDRSYARDSESEPGFQVQMPRTGVMQIVAICAVAYLAQLFVGDPFNSAFYLASDWWRRPWQAYQLLTYGFLHAPGDVGHILVNMFILWMFGRELEQRYGRRELLAFYLSAIVFAGLGWSLLEQVWASSSPDMGGTIFSDSRDAPGLRGNVSLVGASGGVAALMVLYAFNYPHRQMLFMFVIPMPMWVVAAICILWDANGAIHRSGNVAFTAHLAGALLGFLYFKLGWAPGRWVADKIAGTVAARKPRLRVHDPDPATNLNDEVDRILAKIQAEGQSSLTRGERKTLEEASRRYQQKRRN